LLIIIALSIAVCEAVVMLIISVLPPLSTYAEALFDSFLLMILLSPILYLFLFRPLMLFIRDRDRAEEAMQAAKVNAGDERARAESVIAAIGDAWILAKEQDILR
jgi:hypothetical protein